MSKILIIGTVWPEPNSSAAGQRMLQLIALFLSKNWSIIFSSAAAHSDHAIDLNNIGGIEKLSIKLNDASFDKMIKKMQPNVVLFDRFMIEEQFGWRVAEHCPEAVKILNTEDLHFLRKTREESFKSGTNLDFSRMVQNDVTKREIASIYRCDLSLIISDFEMDLLKERFKINPTLLEYLPFLLDPIDDNIKKHWNTFEDRKHFITIGNFRHQPNWNSVLYLKETIWPLIRKELPEAALHIYGAYPPPKAIQLHKPKEGFYIKGWAEDAKAIMTSARVCLAPLRFGAGIKGKLAEAMVCGTPSVTTSIGAEGMLSEDVDWNGFITDDPDLFAKASIRLYRDKQMWLQSQQNGIQIINTKFKKEKYADTLLQKIDLLRKNLEKHRNTNFIGAMLQHHTIRSTEFMSRWIEEKNKNNPDSRNKKST